MNTVVSWHNNKNNNNNIKTISQAHPLPVLSPHRHIPFYKATDISKLFITLTISEFILTEK